MSGTSVERGSKPVAFPRVFSLSMPALGGAYLAGYVFLDWVSYIQPFAPFGITPWNPPPGLSFVLVLLFGQRFVPLLFLAPLFADILVRKLPLPWPMEIVTVVLIGGSYSAGLLLLLRPATRFNPALTSMRDLALLVVVGAASAAFVAVSYVGVLAGGGLISSGDMTAAAVRFWVGDMIGIAVISPFALIFLTRGRSLRLSGELAAQIASVLVALGLVFVYAGTNHFQLFYLLFLPVIWMAVRGGLEAVTVGILLTQLGLILGVQFQPAEDIDVTEFQALMLVLTMTGLSAGALLAEHRRTEFQLRLHQDSLARLARTGSMGELAAAVAHEINQPLMAAGTYARLVAEELRSPGRDTGSILDAAGKAVAQVQRAAEVVRRLRALIRLDQSGRAPSSVGRIVRETIELSRPELDRHGIAVAVEVSNALPPVMVDLLQIEQVALNLVRNAIEAMSGSGRTGGTITVKAALAAPDAVEIEIRDTGPGFPPEFAAGGFPLASTKPDGLGVGLSLCRSIVEAHGGQFIIGGDSPGAVVRFTVPVAGAAEG